MEHESPDGSRPSDIEPSVRCLYANKLCFNPRTIKRNGEMHRLCELHRSNAIRNQRRWHENRIRRAREKRLERTQAELLHQRNSNVDSTDHILELLASLIPDEIPLSQDLSLLEHEFGASDDEELKQYLKELNLPPESLLQLLDGIDTAEPSS